MAPSRRRACAFPHLWLLLRFSNSKGPKCTVIKAIFCLGPPSLKILICLLSFRLWAPDAQFYLAKKRLFIYVRAPAPFTIQTWNFPFLVAFLNFKIQNDRNIQSYEQKFNMHISRILERMARAPSKRRACAFLRLWLLFWISKLKMTEIHGHLNKNSTSIPKICPIPPHFEISNGFPLGPGSLTATPSGYLARKRFFSYLAFSRIARKACFFRKCKFIVQNA